MANRTDNFNRSDTTGPLGTPSDAGSNWVADMSGGGIAFGISSNQAYVSFSSGSNIVTSLEASEADVEIQVTLATFGDQMGVAARVSDGSNYFRVRVFSGEGYNLFKVEAGSATSLGSYSTTPANGDVLKVVCSGDDFEVFVNGVSRITATNSFNNTATRHGLWGFNAESGGARWDDFSITDVAGGGGLSIPIAMHHYKQMMGVN